MDNNILLNSLIARALLSAEDGQKLLTESVQLSKSVEDILSDRRLIPEVELAKAKSEIIGVPFTTVDPKTITEEVRKLIPENTAQTYRAVPLKLEGKMLVVGMNDPQNSSAQEALRFIAKQNQVSLGVYLITRSDLDAVLRLYSSYESDVQKAIRSLDADVSGHDSLRVRRASIDQGRDAEEDAPIIKIVSSTLKSAVEQGASDIHIEPQKDRVRVRFRLDGELREVATFPLKVHDAIVSRVKILTDLKIDESRVPQDGRFRDTIFGKDIDFRVSTFPTPVGEKVAIRVLDPTVGLKNIENLGLVGRNAKTIRRAVERPYGMILVSGPTGSGKTTTIYSLLQILNKEDRNIVSLEDPVEYFVDGVNQSQVKPEIGYTFASGLRQIVRQDPDVIMVGEIRDNETAELAVHAALTGQIVLSTLHANNAIGVIPRLIDMGVEPFLIPSSVNVMLAQRLVRRLNPNCREVLEAPPEIQEIIRTEFAKLPKDIQASVTKFRPPYKIYRPSEKCGRKAFAGRIALFEVFEMTRELELIINTDPTESKIYEEAKRQGVITMRQDGIIKALEGAVSIEDILRETTES
ncbi:MAG: GspE/PulE family protein [Candidatus Colwellbacteria bacterium]|nr:GspE/PulE family protein [Candidatus Colwellbacteria bacterium]